MTVHGGPDIVTEGLVLNLDAANVKSFDPVNTNVELLLHMDGANNSTTFTDSSKNGFTVTANGNAKISTDQSKFGGSSAYFDGNGDFLQIADNDAFEIGGGDFTFEAWVYLTGYSPSYNGYYTASIINKDANNNARSYVFQISGTSSSWTSLSVNLFSSNTSYAVTQASHTFALHTWYHVAASRNGTSLRLYVNGVDIGGGTNSTVAQNTSATIEIGSESPFFANAGYGYYFPGYIDELRIVKGKALYTSNFTPERKPYLDGNKIYDLSGNENNGTLVNGPTYSSDTGGSLIFDGSNDYANATINLSSYSQITTEIWMKCNTTTVAINFEHSSNWNTNAGAFGLAPNSNGLTDDSTLCHTNHNGGAGARNYAFTCGTINYSCHVNIFSNIADSTGRLTYVNGNLLPFSSIGGFSTSTSTSSGSSFRNDIMYFGSRAGTSGFFNGNMAIYRLYNRKLTSAEIQQNYNALKGRYGL